LNAKPDKIVIFHSFLIKPVYEILDKYKLEIPVLTIVTDPFSAPPIWFLQRRQRFVVFSEQLREKCIEKGIDEDRIKVFPFVLKKQFDLKVEKPDLMKIRSDLGFSPGSRIILIMGGGDGMPGGVKLSKKIAKSMPDAEIAIICGNNKKMHSNLNRIKRKNGLMNLKIYGYVDFVYQLLSVSDVVVTKCGASTIMEILLTGKVPLINQFIWEQEKGNVEFVCKGKMGIHEKSVKRLTEVVGRLISDQDFFNSFTGNIRNASLSNGVEPVSDYILSFSNR
jgi:processive 1,2-diacylglycerol beta-glucosyltransferase/1,2-diacylglycerol 3-beta-galactosyltransferase